MRRTVQISLVGLSLAAINGCNSGQDLYPLRIGASWTYTVGNSFSTRVQTVTAERRVPVAFTSGYEITGPMGITRLAWRGSTLYAEAFPNTRIYPPMPILIGNDPTATGNWRGTVYTIAGARSAQAELKEDASPVDIGTHHYNTIHATLSIISAGATSQVETWYAKGIGPIQQDQRTNGKLDYHVVLLNEP